MPYRESSEKPQAMKEASPLEWKDKDKTLAEAASALEQIERGESPVDAAANIENLDASKYAQVMDMVKGKVAAAMEAVKPLLKTVKEKMKPFTFERKVPLPSVAGAIDETKMAELTRIVAEVMESSKNEPKFEMRGVHIENIPAMQGLEHSPWTGKLEEVHTYQAVDFQKVFGKSQEEFLKEIADWETASTDRAQSNVG